MKVFLKNNGKALLFFMAVGLVGGFLLGLTIMGSYPIQMQQQIREQGFNEVSLGLVSASQSLIYGGVLGALGIFFAQKLGLWTGDWSIKRKPLLLAVGVAVLGGLLLIFPDLLFFGRYCQALLDVFQDKPSLLYVLAAVSYGGVIEEVMLRLFIMSLIAFVLYVLFGKKRQPVPAWILVLSNVIAALLFAAGHLPTTFVTLGHSPMILLRCFLLNGGLGLLFGYLYRKYGLRYAMIAHGGCHVVSKLIWLLFI